jgi:hypothetical protein
MFEQIYIYFTLQTLYLWINLGVLPFWFILIFFSNSQICRFFISSIFPILILSIAYIFVFYITFLDNYNFLENFKLYLNINNLSNLFSDNSFLLMFWIHFVSINLFTGGWMVRDGQKLGINKILLSVPLITTYLIGPVGITIYWIIRIFFAKRINLHD